MLATTTEEIESLEVKSAALKGEQEGHTQKRLTGEVRVKV